MNLLQQVLNLPPIVLLVLFLGLYAFLKRHKVLENFASLDDLQYRAATFVQKVSEPIKILSKVKILKKKKSDKEQAPLFKRCTENLLPRIEQNVVNNLERTENDDWDVWYPCGYTKVEAELEKNGNFSHKKSGWVMGITGSDKFAAKDQLWKHLKKHYGRMRATIFTPQTWITYDPQELQEFKTYATQQPKGTMYIMKKNLQRQEGLEIITDSSRATTAFSEDYVVIQSVLTDPYLLNGRKINIRVYILVVCKAGKKSMYAYDDGFVYYSKEPYVNGKTRDEIITTGYLSRDLYEKNPLTLRELLSYIAREHGTPVAEDFMKTRDYLLKGLMEAFSSEVCSVEDNDVVYCQTYGVDMQPNSDLTDMKIIEMNKGASLQVMDEKDGNLKQKMVDDMYRTVGLAVPSDDNGFKKVWSN